MKIQYLIMSVLLLLSGISAVSAASMSGNTVSVTNSLDAAALVYVSGYEITPPVFYPGETGTVTVHVTNAANTSVSVSQPNLIEPHINVVNNGAFATATSIGPGETIDYNFIITADGSDGTYFPFFTVSTTVYGAKAINSQIKVKIDSTDIRASIAKKPDTFALSTKDTVNLSIVNPRTGDITNVLIVPEVNGAAISPDESFVGTLKAGTSVQVPFAITPEKESEVTFHVSYYNGDNKHTTDVVLPLTLGKNKQGAEIVVNNVESSNSGGTITLKGDVTNNGLTDARSVLVTVDSPATPVNPNPVYAIGNLEPDDFSSFEVTYTQTAPGAVPIMVEYKDSDGNVFSKKFTITSNGNAGAAGAASLQNGVAQGPSGASNNRRPGGLFSFGSGLNQVPVTEMVIILLAIIALVIAWRKGLVKRFTDRFRKNQDPDDEIKEQ
ncbi:MAG: hypothetical protein EHM53_03270 [Methanoregulaceae archaeon]|nr:MAG: hypothetical protein EHM53_03270 [Methanoregulaceae archaeon]